MRPLLTAVGVLLPLLSLAQTPAIVHGDPSLGLIQPPTSPALASQSTALAVNPAGLSYLGGLELFYLHERSITRNETGDGLYLGTPLLGLLGAGVSMEWLRGGAPSRRKLNWGLSLGGQALSVGASMATFSAPDAPELAQLRSYSLGLEGRPSPYLAYGLVVRNVDQPSRGSLSLPRTWNVALASRPLGNRYSIAVDYLFQDEQGLDSGRLGYTLQAQLMPGLTLGAGVSNGLRQGDELLLQVSATVDTSSLGLTYSVGGARQGLDHLVGVRASAQQYPSVLAPSGKVALFDLDDLLSPTSSPALSILGVAAEDPYLSFMKRLDGAIRDPSLRGVLLKVNPVGLGLGRSEELRHSLLRLRASGKTVVAVLLSAADSEYLIASAADRIYAVPQAFLPIDGFEANTLFLGAAMEKLGIQWEVARVGAYKNAPDQLTRTGMSPEQREAIAAVLDTDVRVFQSAVATARGLTTQKVAEAIHQGLKTPQQAQQQGLIDGVLIPDDLDKKLAETIPGGRFDPDYRPRSAREDRWGTRPRVAIVPVLGTISGGLSREDPLGLAQTAGAETVIRALRRAVEDPGVAAIVVRVDSPGGDGLASDLIYRAVLDAKKKKPVVASMGDVAASGGYYAAMGADEIFAEPTTVTGSIGVFLIRPAVQQLAQKLGIHQESIRRGDRAGLLGIYEPWTPEQRQSAQQWIDAFYQDFITEVARSRKLDKDRVDAIARGRVWSGADAKDLQLVDQMGGLLEAIDSARRRAGLSEREDVPVEVIGPPRGLLSRLAGAETLSAHLLSPPPALPEGLLRLARELGLEGALSLRPGVMAMMEVRLSIE